MLLDELAEEDGDRPGEAGRCKDMSTAPWLPVSSASDGRSLSAGDEVRSSEAGDLFKVAQLWTLLLPEWPLRNGELTPPTSVLELIVAGRLSTDPALDPARDVGRD